MIYDSIFRALRNEMRLFPETIAGLKRLGFGRSGRMQFVLNRYLMRENPASKSGFQTPTGVTLCRRRDFVVFQELFALDSYRRELWEEPLSSQREPVVLDVGANIGMFAALCVFICPHVQLNCFEMVPECADVISSRLSALGVHQYRVVTGVVGSAHGGEKTVHYTHPFAACNSVKAMTGPREVKVRQVSLDGWRKEVGLEQDAYLVKIDVEGAEKDVLSGGMSTLSAAQYILMELHGTSETSDALYRTHRKIWERQQSADSWVCVLRHR